MAKSKLDIEYRILWHNINGIASEEEVEELQMWLTADGKHRQLYEHLKVNIDKDVVVSEALMAKQWARLQTRIETMHLPQLKTWISYAASVAAVVLVVFSVYMFSDTEPVTTTTHADVIKPGQSKAILMLGSGEQVELCNENKQVIRNEDGAVLASETLNVLSYEQVRETVKIEYNTITVPRGGEYQLVLADGTQVWLNAETELRYPVAFNGSSREVYLNGEALFEVSKDQNKPFLVHSNLSTTKVYGTVFNVMSYADEKVEQTTLVEGSIAVLQGNKEVMIQPGQQARINKSDKLLTLTEVDTDLYTDWKDGIFRFENMPLDEVANKLARWYDVQFFFTNEEVKTCRISGAMKRTTDFSFFMELIKKSSGAKITINENAVHVKAKY